MRARPPKDGLHKLRFPTRKIEFSYLNGQLTGCMKFWDSTGMFYGQRFYLEGRQISKKKYLKACARNPKLPRYAEEKVINTFGNYVRRMKIEKRRQAKNGSTSEELQRQEWFDQEARFEIRKKTSKEALGWLTKKAKAERELGDFSANNASKFVRKLYFLGAIKIWATNIEADVDGDQYSRHLILKLPPEKEKQGKIYNDCSDAVRPFSDGISAIRIGITYMGISLL